MAQKWTKGKYMRDPVHGDVFIENEFLGVIDSPEFQRLRRIKQLSAAYMVFPSADHNRFSHSIGTFHVMKRLLNHFKPMLEEIGVTIEKREENLALAAALLHDLGHGPFSHAFENALPILNQKKHEQWTIDIIESDESEIKRALVNYFDVDFPRDVAEIIKKERDVKHHRTAGTKVEEVNLRFVLSSLISSQLDADRMDYLLRDAFFTGVSIGKFDISRLVNSLTLTVYDDSYYVCVMEKYLPTLEEYVLARFHMYESVYFHGFKCMAELLVKQILFRAYELFQSNKLEVSELPSGLLSVFQGNVMGVSEYCSLDDTVLFAMFNKWRFSKDPILSALCMSFMDRKKFVKLSLLDNEGSDCRDFFKDLSTIFESNGIDQKMAERYHWLSGTKVVESYEDRKDNIWILKGNGVVVDLSELSITAKLNRQKSFAYLDRGLLSDQCGAASDIKKLIHLFDSRSHIEIEKKYSVNRETFELLDKELRRTNYEITQHDCEDQEDTYFDTPDKFLYRSNRTLRIRNNGEGYILTIKAPTLKSFSKAPLLQNERFEYEKQVSTPNIVDYSEFLEKHVPDLKGRIRELGPTLLVENSRRILELKREKVHFEVCLDLVRYKGNGLEAKDCQVEIELKSDYLHRINLKMLTDYLENELEGLQSTTESKYSRGLTLTKQI